MTQAHILILGIGNLLWADEGFGVRAVETLNQRYSFPDHVELMDGGTQGLYLVPHVQNADVLIVFDAIDYGLAPGTIKVIHDQDVPKFMGAKKMSLHQTGFQEVLSMADLLGDYPSKLLLVGVQPEQLEDFGGSLRPVVKAQIAPAIDIVIDYLTALGIKPIPQSEHPQEPLADDSLAIAEYESGRPGDYDACRHGDARILGSKAFQFEPKNLLDENSKISVNVDQRRPE